MTLCQFCKQEFKQPRSHERHCPMNPAKHISNLTTDYAEVQKERSPPEPPKQKPIIITDVVPFNSGTGSESDRVAWFSDGVNKQYQELEYQGLIHTDTGNQIPGVLILTNEGTLLPPVMIAGFMGIFPKDTIWPEPQQPQPSIQPEIDTTEPFPPFPVKEEEENDTQPQPELAKKPFLSFLKQEKK